MSYSRYPFFLFTLSLILISVVQFISMHSVEAASFQVVEKIGVYFPEFDNYSNTVINTTDQDGMDIKFVAEGDNLVLRDGSTNAFLLNVSSNLVKNSMDAVIIRSIKATDPDMLLFEVMTQRSMGSGTFSDYSIIGKQGNKWFKYIDKESFKEFCINFYDAKIRGNVILLERKIMNNGIHKGVLRIKIYEKSKYLKSAVTIGDFVIDWDASVNSFKLISLMEW